ncbi:MAG: GntR family transcriptional regulator [Candidatus Adiutrix sp.]|jgi:GntR family transcriptional regulator|nr:GntR family transcriptional regulator [Candidatus Adiutrix sp.]
MSPAPAVISKTSAEPAYAQLANYLRYRIADGTYPPGSQIPPEVTLGRQFNLSPMTVRRAIGILTDEGLLKPLQGRGTFVRAIDWQNSGFSLRPLAELVSQGGNTKVRMLNIHTVKADERLADKLRVPLQTRLIHVLRLLVRDGAPVLLQSGHLLYDPRQPLVEAELDVISLSGLLSGSSNTLVKKGELETRPKTLNRGEAELLRQPEGSAAFAMEYLFWNFQDECIGCGFFLVPFPFLSFKTKIGLWFDAPERGAAGTPAAS